MTRKVSITIGFILLILLVFLFILLNSHSFQSFLINRLINPLEKKSNVQIEFEKSGFDIYDGLFLDDLSIVDEEDKELISIEHLSISPQSTLISVIKGDLDFQSVDIEGLKLYVNRTNELGAKSNWEKFIASFQSSDKPETKEPQDFFVRELNLSDIKIVYKDELEDRELYFSSKSINIKSRTIDLSKSLIELDDLIIIEPLLFSQNCSEAQKEKIKSTEESDSLKLENEGLTINVKNVKLIEGYLSLSALSKELDDKEQLIENLDVIIRDLYYEGLENVAFTPVDVSFKWNKDLKLTHSSAYRIRLTDETLAIKDFIMRSNLGLIQLDGILSSPEGVSNLDKASFNGEISNSKINLDQLHLMIPDIEAKRWYKNLEADNLYINASIEGGAQNLNLQNVSMYAPGIISFEGDAQISDVTNLERSLISLDVIKSKVDFEGVKRNFSHINVPKELLRLGEVEVTGLFDGFLNDFVAESRVVTGLGSLDMDLNFDIDENNSFSGYLELNQFDLGGLLESDDLGIVSFKADIYEGSGSQLENLKANFTAAVDTFQYRGYSYSNALFTGIMSNKAVDGRFEIKDPHADLIFDGTFDFSQDDLDAQFDIDLNKADLCEMNLTEFPCFASLSGHIDMFGKDLNSLQGVVNLDSILMRKDGEELEIDYLEIISTEIEQGMLLDIASEEIDAKIRGEFDVRTMHKVLLNLFVSDYPDIAKRLNIKAPSGLNGQEEFDFAIEIKDMKEVLNFLESKQLFDIQGELRGRWSSQKGLTTNSYNLDKVGLNGLTFQNVVMNLDSEKGDGAFSLYIDELIQGNRIIDGFQINSEIIESEIFFNIKNHEDQQNQVNISGRGNPWKDGFKFIFEKDVLNIDSTEWKLDDNAQIGYSNNEIHIENFVLQGDNKTLTLDDVDGKGIQLSMNGFPLSLINPIIDYDKMYFEGSTEIDLIAKNIFSKREVVAQLNVPDFTINGDDYGSIAIVGNEGANGLIDASIKIEKDTQSVDILAYYDPNENLVNADISILDYPMSIFEYIINDGISRTSGTTDINARIYGSVSDLKVQGQGMIKNGGTRIDYIGEYYRMEDQVIKLDESKIYLTGVELLDHLGNTAVIEGHLNHEFFANMSTDLTISSDRMIGLFTTRDDNDLYYGTGLGKMTVAFNGPFSEIDIKVDAIAGEGSSLYIPLESNEYNIDKGFVNFDYKADLENDSSALELFEDIKLEGVDFEMNLSFTPEAEVSVIFDESVDEVLRAQGSGDMRVSVTRDGSFEVFGNYLVESGDYLYSSYGVTAKRFLLRRGGVVRWTGDPYNALLDVEADYSGMRAPLDIFLSEFLVSASTQVRQEAQNRTDVGLKLLLGGTLFIPDVDFDISFPNVAGELKAYTDNKMRSLRATENGINNQVFGLMVFNNFLPSNNPLASLSGSTLGQTGNNTISEFFSSQLSLLVSSALSDLVKDGSFINDIDLDIAITQNTSFLEDQGYNLLPNQYGVNVKPTFNNDNWALNVGTNYVTASEVNNVNYLTGDFTLDWFITDDKKLKLRFYGDFNYDEAFASRRQKYGFGINYRREFGNMSELTETLRKIANEITASSAKK